jgi:hypothetical protein
VYVLVFAGITFTWPPEGGDTEPGVGLIEAPVAFAPVQVSVEGLPWLKEILVGLAVNVPLIRFTVVV